MFGKSRKERHALAEEPPVTGVDSGEETPEETLADEDIPTVESPHVVLLRNSKSGPYYLAPDSAEPLPSGMWADLEPSVVNAESERIAGLLDDGSWRMGTLQPELRDFLLNDGVAGRKVIEILEGPSEE